MKKIRSYVIVFMAAAICAALLASCSGSGQSSDIQGVYEGGGVTYVFADDGTVSITENGSVRYGYYTADSGRLEIKLDGENKEYDYTYDGSELELFSHGSIFGVSYNRTEDAPELIEGFVEPETLPDEDDQTSKAISETVSETTEEPSETPAEVTETVEETAPEISETDAQEPDGTAAQEQETATAPTETEPETTVDTFVNQVKGDVYEGAIITFGSYEQDGNTENGTEPIEWIVLKVDGDKALIVSRYGLDSQPIDEAGEAGTWEWCSLRNWLNDSFYNWAFDENERNTIQTTYVSGEPNPDHPDVDNGYGTEDRIFLLSTNQAFIYFSTADRACAPTAYAISKGAVSGQNGMGYWWLRTSGDSSWQNTYVFPDGKIEYDGAATYAPGFMIRPALCVRFR